jgi:hypothetical protein
LKVSSFQEYRTSAVDYKMVFSWNSYSKRASADIKAQIIKDLQEFSARSDLFPSSPERFGGILSCFTLSPGANQSFTVLGIPKADDFVKVVNLDGTVKSSRCKAARMPAFNRQVEE